MVQVIWPADPVDWPGPLGERGLVETGRLGAGQGCECLKGARGDRPGEQEAQGPEAGLLSGPPTWILKSPPNEAGERQGDSKLDTGFSECGGVSRELGG